MSLPARSTIFTEATKPVADVERVSTLQYTHPVMLPEDVKAGFEVASPFLRGTALLLDLIFSSLAAIIAMLVFSLTSFAIGDWGAALALLSVAVILIGYFFVFEGFVAGQTPGKQIMGLRVISLNGEEISGRQGMVRSLLKLIEIGPIPMLWVFIAFGAIEVIYGMLPMMLLWIFVFVDPRHRRLGDVIAGTLVVRQRLPYDYGDGPPVPGYFELAEHYFPLNSRELACLSTDDYVRLEDFAQRIRTIRPPLREQVAMVAAYAVAKKIKYSRPVQPKEAERFLFEVHAAIKEQLRQLYPDLYL